VARIAFPSGVPVDIIAIVRDHPGLTQAESPYRAKVDRTFRSPGRWAGRLAFLAGTEPVYDPVLNSGAGGYRDEYQLLARWLPLLEPGTQFELPLPLPRFAPAATPNRVAPTTIASAQVSDGHLAVTFAAGTAAAGDWLTIENRLYHVVSPGRLWPPRPVAVGAAVESDNPVVWVEVPSAPPALTMAGATPIRAEIPWAEVV